jgi:hypothetical protein
MHYALKAYGGGKAKVVLGLTNYALHHEGLMGEVKLKSFLA